MPGNSPITVALLGAGSRGEMNLGSLFQERPELLRFAAVAEPHDGRRERFVREYGISPQNAFRDFRELLDKPRMADAVICTLPCRLHYEAAMATMKAGYHLLLEKPMALDPGECVELAMTAKESGLVVGVSVQNRFNPIYQKIKALLDEGVVGKLTNIDCAENIAYWHFILSYVRGIHHMSSLSHSFIMAKGIHDIDLILYLTGGLVKRVTSFGSLKFFKEDNAPKGAPERCADGCPAEPGCIYSALKQYVKPGRPDIPPILFTGQSLEAVIDFLRYPRFRSMSSIVTQDDQSEAALMKALSETSFGRCVFRSPNNVVDHQTVSMEMEDGVTVSYALSGFSLVWERTLNFHGSEGEIRSADFSGKLETRTYKPGRVKRTRVPYHGILHGGGDKVLLPHFAEAVKKGNPEGLLIPLTSALESHLVGFAIEKARSEGRVVEMDDFRKSLGV